MNRQLVEVKMSQKNGRFFVGGELTLPKLPNQKKTYFIDLFRKSYVPNIFVQGNYISLIGAHFHDVFFAHQIVD